MKRKYIVFILAFVVICGISFMAYKTVNRLHTKHVIEKSIQTLPHFQITQLDSTHVPFVHTEGKPVVIMYFNSECEHCQYETQALKKHIAQFAHAQILMLSNEPLAKLKTFAQSYGLTGIANLQIAQIPANKSFDTFGFTSVPSLFIYNKNQQLIKQFKGETKIEAVIKAITNEP